MATSSEMPAHVPLTRTEWTTHRLRQAILTGELMPGQKLVATALADQLNVSPTPMREAFVRLAEGGLVELTPQRGARVARISKAEVEEIFALRLLLEPAAVESSTEHTDDDHLADLKEALGELEVALEGGDLESAMQKHGAFHTSLISRCPGNWRKKFVDTLSEHSRRYQVLSPFDDGETGVRMHEHHQLVEAVAARDAAASRTITVAHLEASLERVRKWKDGSE